MGLRRHRLTEKRRAEGLRVLVANLFVVTTSGYVSPSLAWTIGKLDSGVFDVFLILITLTVFQFYHMSTNVILRAVCISRVFLYLLQCCSGGKDVLNPVVHNV